MNWILAGLTAACAFSSGACQAQPSLKPLGLTKAWSLDGLKSPESVVPSADGAFFYVSNVNGEGEVKDGNGTIATVSRDGKLLDLDWAQGLDAPKGLALKGDRLFAADIDRLVEIDTATGRIIAAHPIPGAKFLNDVAVTDDGAVLTSDSDTGRIHAFKDGTLSLWAEHPDFRAINGLLPEHGRLVVTTMQGLLLAVDWSTKAVTRLAQGLGEADGVAALGGGRYLVGEWPGRLFLVEADGTHEVLIDSRKEARFINDFLVLGDLLIAPNWKPGALTAYRISR